MILKHKIYASFIIIISAAIFAACTVSYSFTGASIPIEAKTFTVRDIENVAPTINPTLATDLQQSITEKLLSQTRLGPVDFDGDLIYDIKITGYNVEPTSVTGGQVSVAEENRLTITIKVKYMNRYDKEADFEQSFSQYADYATTSNFANVEDGLVATIIEKLTDDIFNSSVVNW